MEEQAVYIKRAQAGEEEAFCILIRENSGLVHHVAKRFYNRGVEPEDLYQIGCMGLVKAIKRFDTGTAYRFSTYAVPVIMGEIRQFIRSNSQMKISREVQKNRSIVGRCREEFEAKYARTPTIEELETLCGMTAEEITFAMESLLPIESLNEPVGDMQQERQDMLPGGRDEIGLMVNRVCLENLLGQLPGEERKLLYYRYYLDLTQSRTADLLGITQVQVSRREKKVLEKLRSGL